MNLALDYDLTYTLDTKFWDIVIRLALYLGHRVTVVTKRAPDRPISVGGGLLAIPIIYTNRKKKITSMPPGTIWIDDTPRGILLDDGEDPEAALFI